MAVAQSIRNSAADAMYDYTMANGGGTFLPNGFAIKPEWGYAVSTFESVGRAIHEMEFSPSRIVAWSIDAYPTFKAAVNDESNEHLIAFGTWNDGDGFIHLDVVTIVNGLDDALDLARAHNQLAIWSFGDNAEIWVN